MYLSFCGVVTRFLSHFFVKLIQERFLVKSPSFFPLKSSETWLDKFPNGLDKSLNGLERLETQLEPRSSKLIENRVSGIKFRGTVNLHLNGTICCHQWANLHILKTWNEQLYLKIVKNISLLMRTTLLCLKMAWIGKMRFLFDLYFRNDDLLQVSRSRLWMTQNFMIALEL